MDYKELADLIFPDAKEISYYEEKGMVSKVDAAKAIDEIWPELKEILKNK